METQDATDMKEWLSAIRESLHDAGNNSGDTSGSALLVM